MKVKVEFEAELIKASDETSTSVIRVPWGGYTIMPIPGEYCTEILPEFKAGQLIEWRGAPESGEVVRGRLCPLDDDEPVDSDGFVRLSSGISTIYRKASECQIIDENEK